MSTRYAAVVDVVRGDVIYIGPSLGTASTVLIPGRTFGTGQDTEAALRQARKRRNKVLKAFKGNYHPTKEN